MSNSTIDLAVNGTLMRGLELNKNLLAVNATFVEETETIPSYRLWSINDVHPAMQYVKKGGASIKLEIWRIPREELITILLQEPPGLCIGKIKLHDGKSVLGVLGENYICLDAKDITETKGWRNYIDSMKQLR